MEYNPPPRKKRRIEVTRKERKRKYGIELDESFVIPVEDLDSGVSDDSQDDFEEFTFCGDRRGRSYIAMERETPTSIAEKFQVNVNDLISLNSHIPHGNPKARLKLRTEITLPEDFTDPRADQQFSKAKRRK